MKGVYAVVWEQDRSLNKLLCEFYDLGRGRALEGEEENSQDATIYSLLRDYRDPDFPEKKTPVSRSGKQHSQNDLSKQEWNKRETTDGTTLGVESQTQGERRAFNRSRGNSQVDHCSKAEQSYAAREKKQEIKMKASASRLNFEEELSKLFPQESRSSLSPIPKAVHPVSTTPNRTPNHREIKESDNYVRVYNKNQMEMNPLKTSNFGKVEASYSKISPSPKLKVIKNSVLASIGRSGKENRAPSKSSKNSARKPKDFSCQCYKGKSINKVYKQKVLQDISNLDVESSIDKSSVDLYVPKTKRKIKDEYSVASKVDNRREKSQKRTSQAKSILEKQYKCAKIESFDSVISSLKGEIQRNAYNEYKKGFIN
jgi:hypothetical protein